MKLIEILIMIPCIALCQVDRDSLANQDTIMIEYFKIAPTNYKYKNVSVMPNDLDKIEDFKIFLSKDMKSKHQFESGKTIGRVGSIMSIVSSWVLAEEGIRHLLTGNWSPAVVVVAATFTFPVPMLCWSAYDSRIASSVEIFNDEKMMRHSRE